MSDYTGENTLVRTLPSDRCTVQLATCKKGGIHVSQHTHTHILANLKIGKFEEKKKEKICLPPPMAIELYALRRWCGLAAMLESTVFSRHTGALIWWSRLLQSAHSTPRY